MLSFPVNSLRLILENGDSQCFVKYIRFNRAVFECLAQKVSFVYDSISLYQTNGQARLHSRAFSSKEALFLTLRYLASGIMLNDLSLICGASPSTISRSIVRCLDCLLAVLRRWNQSRFRIPSTSEEASRMSALASHHVPGCDGFIGVMDGKVVSMERPDDSHVQSVNYNGKNFTTAIKVSWLKCSLPLLHLI
jgi:hypothetical protein